MLEAKRLASTKSTTYNRSARFLCVLLSNLSLSSSFALASPSTPLPVTVTVSSSSTARTGERLTRG
jgi:hypothetical protein